MDIIIFNIQWLIRALPLEALRYSQLACDDIHYMAWRGSLLVANEEDDGTNESTEIALYPDADSLPIAFCGFGGIDQEVILSCAKCVLSCTGMLCFGDSQPS